MAIARLKGAEAASGNRRVLRLIVVVTEAEQVPPSARDLLIVTRPKNITDDPEAFIAELGSHLRRLATETRVARSTEPRRLFEAKEYRAAVISAMTLLEAQLRERLNKSPWPQTRRPLTLRSLIDLAVEHQIIQPERKDRIDAWMRTRNEVVHSSVLVSKANAREIVEGVMQLIDQWA